MFYNNKTNLTMLFLFIIFYYSPYYRESVSCLKCINPGFKKLSLNVLDAVQTMYKHTWAQAWKMKPWGNWLIAGKIGHSPLLLTEQVTNYNLKALKEWTATQLWSDIGLVGVLRLSWKGKPWCPRIYSLVLPTERAWRWWESHGSNGNVDMIPGQGRESVRWNWNMLLCWKQWHTQRMMGT